MIAIFDLRRVCPSLCALAVLMSVIVVGPYADTAQAAPGQISYILLPHPDDDYQTWSLVTGSSSNYKVFIHMTQGEQSGYCEPNGKYGYEGPGSPVQEYNRGEINPLGTGTNIWIARWTDTCENARMQGTLAFLRTRAVSDPAIPGGSFTELPPPTLTGYTRSGLAPRRFDNDFNTGSGSISRGVRVFRASNGMGTVIFFDLGDLDVKKEEVEWAVGKVRQYKSAFGIPTNLPEYNAVAAYSHLTGRYENCMAYDHPDHRAVHEATWEYDLLSGRPRHARTCSKDPDVDPGRTRALSQAEHAAILEGTYSTRRGIFQQRYGWLAEDNWPYALDGRDTLMAREHHFWTR